jgi:hypothetical protein
MDEIESLVTHAVVWTDSRGWLLEPRAQRRERDYRKRRPGDGAGEVASTQAVRHVLRSDCQQISAQPSERNAAWMSARFSYRTRRRRN